MMNRSQKYTISGILTLLTVATTAGISRGGPEGIPAQLTPNINVFRETETMNGVTLEKDAHNIVICPAGTASPIAAQELHQTDDRFWAYEYSGNEPAVLGKFYISWGELLAHPRYASINGLRSFTGGKRYYVMSSVTLQFRCNVGLTKPAECGNGRREGDERCDVVHEGCNQTTCKPNEGYVCENNVCRIYIPVLGGGSASSASSSSQEIVIDPVHTVCQGDACVLRLGPGHNECQTAKDCRNGSSASSAHSQASSIYDHWHTECRNNACVTVEGPGPSQCRQHSDDCGGSSRSTTSASSAQQTGSLTVRNHQLIADGTSVPTGHTDLGWFFLRNTGSSMARIDGIIFDVDATNVIMDAQSFAFVNMADSTVKAPCSVRYAQGEQYTGTQISGKFVVLCTDFAAASVPTEIDGNSGTRVLLAGTVVDSSLSGTVASKLQISLTNFTKHADTFGPTASHIQWFDDSTQMTRYFIEQSESSIFSTRYDG